MAHHSLAQNTSRHRQPHSTPYSSNSKMKAMMVKKCWFSSILERREVKVPEIKDNEVLIKVIAVGVNRGDMIDVATGVDGVCPGLECSGIIEAVGRNVNCWKVGQRVCAILEGGGYAEEVAVPADFLLPLPDDIDLQDAAGLPYASCIILLALLKSHDTHMKLLGTHPRNRSILIHEGTSGTGALAIQYAKYMGFRVIASTGDIVYRIIILSTFLFPQQCIILSTFLLMISSGSRDEFATCRRYGADYCVDHTSSNFVRAVNEKSGFKGVNLVLDYGASDLQENIECCHNPGKVVIVDLHGRESDDIDLSILQQRQVEIKVIDLRSKDFGYKASAITELRTHLWPAILEQKVVPAIEHRFPVIEYQKALDLLRKDDSAGKSIVLMNFEQTSDHLKMC